MKKILVIAVSLFMVTILSACNKGDKNTVKTNETLSTTEKGVNYDYVSLVGDKYYRRGFNVWGLGLPIYGDPIELYGGDYEKQTDINFDYDIDQDKDPVWRLQQWATRYPFHDKENRMDPDDYKFSVLGDSHYLYQNKSKELEVNTKTSEIRLGLKASECYIRGDRTAYQEWPHLLLAQDFGKPANPTDQMCVSKSKSMKIHLDMKMNSFEDKMINPDPSMHSAILMFYLFVSYQPKGYIGYKDMIWLGVSLFDNRSAYPNGMSCIDEGTKASSTGKWIYNIGTSNYLNPDNNIYDIKGNIQYDKWVTIDIEVLPYISQALKEAQAGGCMKGATMDDLYISGMYIGYELPGTYDIDMTFKNLDVTSLIEVQ